MNVIIKMNIGGSCMNNCPNCGANLNFGDEFCRICGTKISSSQNSFYNSEQQQINSQGINMQQQNANMNSQLTNNTLNNNNGLCKLTLTRPNEFIGSLWNLKVYVDGEKRCILKNGESITLDVKKGNHHISFSGYSNYTLQVLGDATVKVVPTDSSQILLQDLVGANIIEDENNPYNRKSHTISRLVLASTLLIFLLAAIFSQFMSDITAFLFIIVIDIIIALIGFYFTKKHQHKLGYAFKKVMYDYIGSIIIDIISIVVCIIIKGF